MSYLETATCYGVSCDKRDCDERIVGDEMAAGHGNRYYDNLARGQGWSIWYGSRTRRMFCPAHRPSKGSNMQEDTR